MSAARQRKVRPPLQPVLASLRDVAARCRYEDDRTHHAGVNVAEVLVGSRRGEGERIAVVGVERLRFGERVARRGNAVRDIVPVGPDGRLLLFRS